MIWRIKMREEKFKLPHASYDELCKIIKAYGHLNKPSSLNDVSQVSSLHTTIISRNAGFLIATEIITSGAKKEVTDKGREIYQALEHEIPEQIRKWWRTIIEECDFLTKILTAIKIRKGMDAATLEAHIAYSAGQPKKSQVMTGARTVIDIIRAAELITEADGKIVLAKHPDIFESKIPRESNTVQDKTEAQDKLPLQVSNIKMHSQNVPFQINVQLKIDCKPNELGGLGAKLRNLIDELSAKET